MFIKKIIKIVIAHSLNIVRRKITLLCCENLNIDELLQFTGDV